jgi:hypothetical protein
MAEIKPCPFCGGSVKFTMSCLDSMIPIGIFCTRCKADFSFYDKKNDLVAGSNKILRRWDKRK